MYLLLFILFFVSLYPLLPSRDIAYRQAIVDLLSTMPYKSHSPRVWNRWVHRFRHQHHVIHRKFIRSLR
jgi:hypothetical protein